MPLSFPVNEECSSTRYRESLLTEECDWLVRQPFVRFWLNSKMTILFLSYCVTKNCPRNFLVNANTLVYDAYHCSVMNFPERIHEMCVMYH